MLPEHPSLLWVRVHTDRDVVGLGETVGVPTAVARALHDMLAGLVIGADPAEIESIWLRCYRAINYYGIGGAEMRALSAIDIALWDVLGKVTRQPVHVLLGGPSRAAVPVYHTCGSYGDIKDSERFMTEPAELARELVSSGVRATKIWPFDSLAETHGGQFVDRAAIRTGVERVRAMRDAGGEDFEIAVEGHGLWNLPMAIRIAKAVEPLHPLWIEDFVWPEAADALRRLSAATTIPVIASERLLTRFGFNQVIRTGGAQILMFDLAWSGGISECRKIAAAAATHLLPIAPHNCGGPVGHAANVQFCAHIPNLMLMETIRAFYQGFYDELAIGVMKPNGGSVRVPTEPGLGIELRPEVLSRTDIIREVTTDPSRQAVGLASGDPWKTAKF